MNGRAWRIGFVGFVCVWVAVVLVAQAAPDGGQAAGAPSAPQTYKGLEIAVTGFERAASVGLRDCPPGANTVRGVIKPGEVNEFATVKIDVKVLPSFKPVMLKKPVLYDQAGKAYNTAQSFADLNSSPSYACEFAFRVPKGTKIRRFAIESATFDLASFESQ